MKKTEKVGVYGGTFNPPHIGHVKCAEAFSKAINLDKLLIIPDFLPPHKEMDTYVSAQDRLNMCTLAFSKIKNVEISDMEIKRGGKSYTSHTLEELARKDRELFFLCGTDMFLTMGTWYRPEVIFNLATVCFVRREEDAEIGKLIKEAQERYKAQYNARIIEISSDVVVLSSSEVRNSINALKTESLLPKDVLDYVKEKGLY